MENVSRQEAGAGGGVGLFLWLEKVPDGFGVVSGSPMAGDGLRMARRSSSVPFPRFSSEAFRAGPGLRNRSLDCSADGGPVRTAREGTPGRIYHLFATAVQKPLPSAGGGNGNPPKSGGKFVISSS